MSTGSEHGGMVPPTPSAPVVDDVMVRVIACALAREDGYDPDDMHGGLYDLCWSGGSAPEPLGDVWEVDYLPKAERIAASLSGVSAPVGRHWCFAAAEGLRPLIESLALDGGELGRAHLLSMLDRMKDESMSDTKGCRWLGWIQAALVVGPFTLKAMKAHNLSYSRESTPTAAPRVEGECKPSTLGGMVPGRKNCCSATPAAPRVEGYTPASADSFDSHHNTATPSEDNATPAAAPKVEEPTLVPKMPGNWPEDASHENGDYECTCVHCGATFYGHKRRVVCKVCATPAASDEGEQA